MLRGVNMDVSAALKQRGLDWRPTPEFGGWRMSPAFKLGSTNSSLSVADGLVGQPSLTTGPKCDQKHTLLSSRLLNLLRLILLEEIR
jgi:hypothetical protein